MLEIDKKLVPFLDMVPSRVSSGWLPKNPLGYHPIWHLLREESFAVGDDGMRI